MNEKWYVLSHLPLDGFHLVEVLTNELTIGNDWVEEPISAEEKENRTNAAREAADRRFINLMKFSEDEE